MTLRVRYTAVVIVMFVVLTGRNCSSSVFAAAQSKPEEIEWTWEVQPSHPDASLPNVLLVGDSITRNYFPQVTRDLKGIANVYLTASSICVGDPRLPAELISFAKMEGVRFRVVHFNNGMHGWDYSEAEYKAGFPAFLAALQQIGPGSKLIWATTTPVRKGKEPGPSNVRIDARNAIALTFLHGMAVDDQHALMAKHTDLYHDDVHFNDEGSNIAGDAAAATIRRALDESRSQ
ncbi:MAG: SGNH/GDSL hydrolase family protein [Silvibacterium sp.]